VGSVGPFEVGEEVVTRCAEGSGGEELECCMAERLRWTEWKGGGGEEGVEPYECE
jgi:hypothetical protein